MLVLNRAKGEIISIGDDIALQVLELKGTQITLGIQAPAGVEVYRAEANQKIPERQATAPQTNP